jgi:hypothetical protein
MWRSAKSAKTFQSYGVSECLPRLEVVAENATAELADLRRPRSQFLAGRLNGYCLENRQQSLLKGVEVNLTLSDRELATVLAALRNWQRDLAVNEVQGQGRISEEHFHDVEPLTVTEIDQLCDRLNCG